MSADNKKQGRPVKFETATDMQAAIDKYFKKCDKDKDVYTICGLALALDMTRETLLRYAEKSADFSDTITKAKLRVEAQLEQRLLTNQSVAGIIFNLKNNFKWVDKTEVSQNVTVNEPLDKQLIEGRQNLRKQLEEGQTKPN